MKQYLNYDQSPKTGLSIYYYFHNFFKKIEFTLLVVICLVFIGLSKNNKQFNDNVSLFFVNLSLPISGAVTFPFGTSGDVFNYFEELMQAKRENDILRAENEKLKAVYIKALNISQENEELQELLQFISTKSINYKTVRLITKTNQSYGNSIIINAGSKQGISENNIITGKKSVVGRVIQVGDNISRVLTITDENSRIPVITSNSRAKGILSGNNGRNMAIEYLDKDHKIEVGDLVFTSGDGEYLPPGLLAGVVTKVSGENVTVKAIENPDNINLAVISIY